MSKYYKDHYDVIVIGGACRIKILKGACYVCPVNDGRRSQDRIFGYVHACSAYPTSDIEIKVDIDQ